MSIPELARRMGYKGHGTISMVLSGERPIPKHKIHAFADALRLDNAERTRFILLAYISTSRLPDWLQYQIVTHELKIRDLEEKYPKLLEQLDRCSNERDELLRILRKNDIAIPNHIL